MLGEYSWEPHRYHSDQQADGRQSRGNRGQGGRVARNAPCRDKRTCVVTQPICLCHNLQDHRHTDGVCAKTLLQIKRHGKRSHRSTNSGCGEQFLLERRAEARVERDVVFAGTQCAAGVHKEVHIAIIRVHGRSAN